MTFESDRILLDYANVFWKARPRSETHHIPSHQELADAVTEFLQYEYWYCDPWPGREYLTFFSWVEPVGLVASYGVHIDTQTVVKLT